MNHSISLLLVAASLAAAPCNAQESGQRLRLNTTRAAGSRTTVVTLGTGSPPADPNRYGPATAIIVDSSVYLFDSGVGVVRRWAAAIRKDIGPFSPFDLRTVFLTHLHTDHTLGLSELIFSSWTGRGKPLDLYGPAGTRSMVEHLVAAYSEDVRIRIGPGGDREGGTPPDVRVTEIHPGVAYRDARVTITAFAVHHGSWAQAFGYRIQTPDKVIVLSGDAAPPSAIPAQCHECDILIHEGGEAAAEVANDYWNRNHTTAEQLLDVVRVARPKLLVLYHQRSAPNEAGLEILRRGFGPNVVVANDIDVFRSTPDPRTSDSTDIVLLGTHGTYGIPPGSSGTGTAITVGERLFVFDAGEGAAHQIAEAELHLNRIEAIFITALRDDHVLGLPALLVTPRASGRTSPVAVYGPAGTRETATRMWAAFDAARKEKTAALPPATRAVARAFIDTGSYSTDIEPGIVYDSAGVRVTAFLVDHGASTKSYGYRIDTPGRSIAISGDTRPSENLAKAAMGVDVLIHNVYALAKVNDTSFYAASLASAEEAGAMAARLTPRLLILTHILPNGRATDAELIAGVRRGGFTGQVVVGRDLERY